MGLNIQKSLSLLLICFVLIILLSCEWGNEILSVEMGKLPERIVYIANVDTELDFGNSTTITTTRQGNKDEWPIKDSRSLTIKHNVDFTKPGIYEVEILYVNTVIYDYLVQVIDDNTYAELKNR